MCRVRQLGLSRIKFETRSTTWPVLTIRLYNTYFIGVGKKIPEVLAGGELTLEGAEKRLVWGMGSGKELEKGGQRSGRETMKRGAKKSAFERAPRAMAGSFLDFFVVLAPD